MSPKTKGARGVGRGGVTERIEAWGRRAGRGTVGHVRQRRCVLRRRSIREAPMTRSNAPETPRRSSFPEFWAAYLLHHAHPMTRLLHSIGTVLVLAGLAWGAATLSIVPIVLGVVVGYACAFTGHWYVEASQPLTLEPDPRRPLQPRPLRAGVPGNLSHRRRLRRSREAGPRRRPLRPRAGVPGCSRELLSEPSTAPASSPLPSTPVATSPVMPDCAAYRARVERERSLTSTFAEPTAKGLDDAIGERTLVVSATARP